MLRPKQITRTRLYCDIYTLWRRELLDSSNLCKIISHIQIPYDWELDEQRTMSINLQHANAETLAIWNANAAYWDNRMGDTGNDFVNELIRPAVTHLLAPQPSERVLDIACGNGLYPRRLAALGAEVVAFDFAQSMIDHATQYATEHASQSAIMPWMRPTKPPFSA